MRNVPSHIQLKKVDPLQWETSSHSATNMWLSVDMIFDILQEKKHLQAVLSVVLLENIFWDPECTRSSKDEDKTVCIPSQLKHIVQLPLLKNILLVYSCFQIGAYRFLNVEIIAETENSTFPRSAGSWNYVEP